MRNPVWQTLMGICLLMMTALLSWRAGRLEPAREAAVGTLGEKDFLVAIDPGHGGRDPGKVGAEGQLEKEINLKIALKLKEYLEASDVDVLLTRTKDEGLYGEGDSSKKMADMEARCRMINEARPDAVISIHQNSYQDEAVNGGQVFYCGTSREGKELAEILQKRFDYVLGEENRRSQKANDSYYLLLHVNAPAVIVECGFLSNPQEARKLESEAYQDRLAWTLHMGIMEFLNKKKEETL